MPKQESTAINDLIHLVQGRIIDDSGDAQDNLFVTPLPRRRAPNATPPIVPVQAFDYEDDDVATSVDPHSLDADPAWALGSAPNPRPSAPGYAVSAYPQAMLYPTPAPLPPAPYHADADATERVEQYDDLPPSEWSTRPARPPRRTIEPHFDSHLDTVRVPALPRPRDLEDNDDDDAPPSELVVLLKKCVLPFAGLSVVLMFVGGALVHRGQGGHKREVPVVMAVTPAPIVTPITVSAAMVDESAPPATWKPNAVQPTIAPTVEPIVEPIVEPAPVAAEPVAEEIEMAPTKVGKRRSRTKKPAAERVVVARPSRSEARGRKADPIEVAIAEPTKPAKAKGTGPAKVTITSTPSALIYVDGRSTNQMTPKTLTLAPGVHKITLLELATRKAKTAELDVKAGEAAQIAKTF